MGSMRPIARWRLLLTATLWAAVWLGIAFLHHINEPAGMTGITINGHTYVGHPPALTLFERDPFSMFLALGIVGGALLAAFVEAGVLSARRSTDRAGLTTGLGVLLLLYSVLGVFWGIMSIGVTGFLVLFSASPAWARRSKS